jgi:hypothetical protein
MFSFKTGYALLAACLISCSIASADTIAIDAGAQTGNQQWTGAGGTDFNVLSPVLITALGAFDSGGDGFSGAIRVVIYNRNTQTQVTPVISLTGTSDALIDGDRFASITPTLLPIGNYSVVGIGFSANDLNGNTVCNNITIPVTECLGNTVNAATLNTAGLLSFGDTRHGPDNGVLEYPTLLIGDLPAGSFLAGTFEFTAAPTAVPEPGAIGLLAMGIVSLALAFRTSRAAAGAKPAQ